MEKIFLSVLNMSLTASFVIAVVMLVRLPLKKAPKIISYALWAVAGFRLVCPFTLESMFSLFPFKAAPIPQDIARQTLPRIDSGVAVIDRAVNASLPAAAPAARANPLQIWLTIGAHVWLFGILILLVYSFASILLLKRGLRSASPIGDDLYEAGHLKTPFVIGLFRPKIYIPTGLSDEERRFILLHEQTH
ncbi:MAG: M56 family metallopeptidase, partial [Oscillospiraceae bacterium]|nr:M56 family metallopeptidase [Oscillospiraceae bacterium]